MQGNAFNIRHLRAFQMVAQSHGISAASRLLNMSQPATTQAISRLESRLKTQLFLRSNKGMIPTEAGAALSNRVGRALAFIESGCNQAVQQHKRGAQIRFAHQVSSTQLRALVAVAAHGNYSVAARALGVSQPSVFRAARELEQLSRLTLFERNRTGISLTPAAQSLTRAARLAFTELDQGLDDLAALNGQDSGTLTIGSLPLARAHLLPRAINMLCQIRPAARIAVIDGPYDDLLRELRDGQIDLMVGALRDPAPADDVTQEALFDDRLGIFCRAGHPLTRVAGVTAAALGNQPWVLPRRGTPTRAGFEAFFHHHALPLPGRIVESSSMILARGLVTGGDWLTMISENQVSEELRAGLFHRLDIALNDPPRPIGLTFRKTWQPTMTQQQGLQILRQIGRDLPGS